MRGLTSISTMSGRVRIRRPSAAATAATALISAGGEPRNPCSSFAVLSLPSSSTISSSVRSGAISRTSPRASTQMPPRPTIRTGPHRGSRRAPTTSSSPRGDMASTRTPSSCRPGCARSTLACNAAQVLRTASPSATPRATPPASVLCASCAACAFIATG